MRMQVLILEDDPGFQAQLAQAMMGKGFHVLGVDTVPAAEAFLRLDMADVLIFGERIGGRLSHSVALLAECRNPLVAAVLLTDRTGPAVDELFDLMPSLVGILGRPVSPVMVTQVVMAAVANMASDTVRSRLAQRWAAADREEGEDPSLPAVRIRPTVAAGPTAGQHDDPWHDLGTEGEEDTTPASPDLPALTALVATAPDTAAPPAMTFTTHAAPASPLPALAGFPALAAAPSLTPAAVADPVSDDLAPAATFLPALPDAGPALPPLPALTTAPPRGHDPAAASAPLADLARDTRSAAPGLARAGLAIPRPVKPSPDSPLARLLARGAGSLSRPILPGTHPAADGTASAVSRPAAPATTAALPAWLNRHHNAAAVPALPTPPPRPFPVPPTERRLHLA
jgi:hypothetical protein